MRVIYRSSRLRCKYAVVHVHQALWDAAGPG